jgi:hypothetical protein
MSTSTPLRRRLVRRPRRSTAPKDQQQRPLLHQWKYSWNLSLTLNSLNTPTPLGIRAHPAERPPTPAGLPPPPTLQPPAGSGRSDHKTPAHSRRRCVPYPRPDYRYSRTSRSWRSGSQHGHPEKAAHKPSTDTIPTRLTGLALSSAWLSPCP